MISSVFISMLLTICRKLFELLSFSTALAELTWPVILSKRPIFRYLSIALVLCVAFKLSRFTRISYYSQAFPGRWLFLHVLECRDVFLDFDPIAVSKLNDKKIATQGSPASSLLSELKLRAIIENARQICKVCNEFLILLNFASLIGK